MKRIVADVFGFSGLLVGRVYAVTDADSLTLIDAGMRLTAGRILAQLAAAGYAPSDVKRILLTHTHFDHAGGLHAIQKATGAQVFVSALEAGTVRGTAELPRPTGRRFSIMPRQFLRPSPVHRELQDGDTIAGPLGGLVAIATPGHTFGHLSFWSPSRNIMFTGDVLLHTLGIAFPLPFVSVSMALNRESTRKIAALAPDTLLFGHGAPIVSGAAERLRMFVRNRRLE